MKFTVLHAVALITILVLLNGCGSRSSPQSTPEAGPTPTLAVLPSPMPQSTPMPSATPDPTPTFAPTPSIPESHYISISGHKQAYPLSCEASAAVDWAAYFGVDIYEYDFQTALPLSDNPDFGFCGDVYTDKWGQIPPYAYGVHAGPVADLLRAYGLPALSVTGWSIDQVKQKLAENKPILVWVIGNMEFSYPVIYVDKEGRKVKVAAYEHAVILTGYDAATIRYMNNGSFYEVPNQVFLTSWGVLNNMAVVYE